GIRARTVTGVQTCALPILVDDSPEVDQELLRGEDFLIDLGRVVDHDQDLGLRVEVRAGPDAELVECYAAGAGHFVRLYPTGAVKIGRAACRENVTRSGGAW